jgi:hypothetical protein
VHIRLFVFHPLCLSLTTRVITYTYDHLYGLTGADYSTFEQFQYAYDGVGDPVSTSLRGTNCRTVQTRTLASTTVTTYTYDHANRLDCFYADGVQTDLDWDANPLRCASGTGAASCAPKAPTCILGTLPTAW